MGSPSLYDFRADHETDYDVVVDHLKELRKKQDYLFYKVSIEGLAHCPEAVNIMTTAAETLNSAIAAACDNPPFFLAIDMNPSCMAHHLHNMIVLDAMFRAENIEFSVSIDASPTRDIYELLLNIEDKLKRPLTVQEAHEVSNYILEEGLPIDRMFLDPETEIPYTSSILFPSQLSNMLANGVDARLTAAPSDTYRLTRNDSVQDTANIDMNHPSVLRTMKDSTFIKAWGEIKSRHSQVNQDSDLGQTINSIHCVRQTEGMHATSKTNIIHIGGLNEYGNQTLLSAAQAKGFTTINTSLLTGDEPQEIIGAYQTPKFLRSEKSFDHEQLPLSVGRYAEEMESATILLSALGLEILFVHDAKEEMEYHRSFIDEWTSEIAQGYSSDPPSPDNLN